jgi:hypothetical protein
MKGFIKYLISMTSIGVMVVFPSSTNYQLGSFEFGGGGEVMNSESYTAEAIIGEPGGNMSSENYTASSSLLFVQQANTPPNPDLSNPSNYYNKLLLIINTDNNPTDATYAVAITDDDWVTTQYVQSDNTIGPSLGTEDYQTYAAWGAGSGELIIGLDPDIEYKAKVKARRGVYTEGPFGPDDSASTSPVTISFDIDVATTDTETASPYNLEVGSLSIGSVTTASQKVWVDLITNAEGGGRIFINGVNSGLRSTVLNHTITSSSTDLSSINEGYGMKNDTVSNLTAVSPYNGSGENVGVLDSTIRELANSSSSPVTNGRASFQIKVKTSNTTPSANDYVDTLTLIASGNF